MRGLALRYIQFVADRFLTALSCPRIYHEQNPLDWMELVSMRGKKNFFEKWVDECQKANVMGARKSKSFALDVEF